MPQLDPSSFPSQLFWLAVTFFCLYFIMWRVALPRITGVLQGRQNRISNDLERARTLRDDAEKLQAEYERSLMDTRAKAQQMTADAVHKMQQLSEERHAALDKELFKASSDAQKKILDARDTALDEIAAASSEISVAIVKKIAGVKVSSKDADTMVMEVLKSEG